jgi:hypothetical protein
MIVDRERCFLYVNPHGAHVLHGRKFVHLLEGAGTVRRPGRYMKPRIPCELGMGGPQIITTCRHRSAVPS